AEEKPEQIEEWCEELARRGQFVRVQGIETLPDGTVVGRYAFIHALYQQVLYEQLADAQRIRLYRRIGEWQEIAHGNRVDQYAAELAVHFERGQGAQRAVQYLWRAAGNAGRRPAPREAIALLTKSLALLQTWPDTPERAQQELALHISLGVPLLMT